jgi:hypothetical protein
MGSFCITSLLAAQRQKTVSLEKRCLRGRYSGLETPEKANKLGTDNPMDVHFQLML